MLNILLPKSVDKVLSRKPELIAKLESDSYQEELVNLQLEIEKSILANPNISRSDFQKLIINRPKSEQRIFLKAFDIITKKQAVIKSLLTDQKYWTNGCVDPIKIWKAVSFVELEPKTGEIEIIPDPYFLRFRITRKELGGSNFGEVAAVSSQCQIEELNSSVMIEFKDASLTDLELQHEQEHFLQKVVLQALGRQDIQTSIGDRNSVKLTLNYWKREIFRKQYYLPLYENYDLINKALNEQQIANIRENFREFHTKIFVTTAQNGIKYEFAANLLDEDLEKIPKLLNSSEHIQ
jgi:hypothetical protein